MLWLLFLSASVLALETSLSPTELFAQADLVVVAETTSAEVRWSEGPTGGVETMVWLAPLEVAKGSAPSTVSLLLPGGTLGDTTTWVEDVPELRVDEAYLLFLIDTPAGWMVLGGEQGAVHLEVSDAP